MPNKMKKDYKLQVACQIESISTRADHSLKVVMGLPELPPEESAALMGLNRLSANILISPNEITQEDVDNIDTISDEDKELFGKKAKTKSQRLRGVLYRVWENLGNKGTSKDHYATEMDKICEHYINTYLE